MSEIYFEINLVGVEWNIECGLWERGDIPGRLVLITGW